MNNPHPILITGVGKRAGYAIALDLLAQGYPLIGTFRSETEALTELAAKGATLYHTDLYEPRSIAQLIGAVKRSHSALRGIIHNASDWLPDGSGQPSEDIFQRMMQVHAGAPYQINRSLQPLLERAAGGADIIHLTDYVAERGSARHIAYAASKAALQNMTLSFAALMAPLVQVNAIAPSLIAFNSGDSDAYRQKALDKSILRIEPGFSELVSAVNYLLSSRYITGRTLNLDGGRHIR